MQAPYASAVRCDDRLVGGEEREENHRTIGVDAMRLEHVQRAQSKGSRSKQSSSGPRQTAREEVQNGDRGGSEEDAHDPRQQCEVVQRLGRLLQRRDGLTRDQRPCEIDSAQDIEEQRRMEEHLRNPIPGGHFCPRSDEGIGVGQNVVGKPPIEAVHSRRERDHDDDT